MTAIPNHHTKITINAADTLFHTNHLIFPIKRWLLMVLIAEYQSKH
ncbi:hypothetical protein IMCC1989_1270 [gamma proteobacterium IMCC1989]|nr:hypothetical protein IMCC1989_1270 [gamma proteobacterium IMCC1989]